MLKTHCFILFFIFSLFVHAQKHSISIKSGTQRVGFYSKLNIDLMDDTPYPPDNMPTRTYKQKISKFNRGTAMITYNYQWREKWRLVVGLRGSSKGYGLEQTVFYPKTKQTFVFDDENHIPKMGLIAGVENILIQKNRFSMGWQGYLIPEVTNDLKFQEGGVSFMGGIHAEFRIWKSLKLIANPFGEVGIVPYLDHFLGEFKPYGYGFHFGLNFKI